MQAEEFKENFLLMADPEVRLISCTEFPVETLLSVWIQSRPSQFPDVFAWLKSKGYAVLTAKCLRKALTEVQSESISAESLSKVFSDAIKADLPISESIHFTWGFANLPIEWREQAVRKRLWGFWLTSMREFSMENFFDEGRFSLPAGVSESSKGKFIGMMERIQTFYGELLAEGWPPEKARKVIPLCAAHNGAMFSTLRTLRSTLQQRSCWIAQADQWMPFISSVVSELRSKHRLLGDMVTPPCFLEGSNLFKGCKYHLTNVNRWNGNDSYAPCPIWCSLETRDEWVKAICANREKEFVVDGVRLLDIWKGIWRRNPFTGALIE